MTAKGQAINIDWTIGLSLFLLAALSSVLTVSQPDAIGFTEKAMDNTLSEITSNIEEETFVEGRRTNLYINSPVDLNRKIPVDRKYYFSNFSSEGSGRMDTLSKVDISENNVKTVLEMENSTHRLTYVNGKLLKPDQATDIETGSEISNSLISVNPGSPGLTSLEINGKELLNSDADFRFNEYSINEDEISATTFSENLTVYSNSSEFIVENTGSATFNIKNLTTLYWYADNSTTELKGSVSKSGDTKGLTIASDYGITFLGDLNANVTKQSSSDTVEVQIDTERLRVMSHDSDYVEGWKRIKTYDKGEIYFGGAEKIEGATKQRIQELEQTSELDFEQRLELGNLGYNITYGIPGTIGRTDFNAIQKISDQTGWNTGSFKGTSADRKDNSGTLGIGYKNGSKETELTEGLIGYWRMDRAVAGDGGTVKDYSGNGNDGQTYDGVTTGVEGIFSTNSSSFDNQNYNRVEIPDIGDSLNKTNEFTISYWINYDEFINYKVAYGNRPFWTEPYRDGSSGVSINIVDSNNNDYTLQSGEVLDSTNQWYQISYTWNGQDLKAYVNGSEAGSLDTGGATLDIPSRHSIGSYLNGGNNDVDATIDEVRVYNRSLSESQIQKLYFKGQNGDFVGNYSGNRVGSDEERNWTKIEINASVPPQTDLSANAEVYNEFGNDLGEQLIDVRNGTENYTLNVREAEQLQLDFNGTSTNVTKSWEVYNFKVYTGSEIQRSIIKRGNQLPTRNTFVRDSQPGFIRDNGSLGTIESRVILWE